MTYKSIKLAGSRPGILYGLGKIHQETCSGLAPFCRILSAIGTPTYKLAKFLLNFLTRSTANEYYVIDSFHFAEEFCQQDSNLHMASLDIAMSRQSMHWFFIYKYSPRRNHWYLCWQLMQWQWEPP